MLILTAVRVAHVCWCAAILVAILAIDVEARDRLSVVRVLNTRIADALDDGYAASPTVRALIDELERSDLIIHVLGMSMQQRHQLSGAMRFVQRAGDRRFLRIFVDQRLTPERRAAVLAHELQHAVEVARHAFVVDEATLVLLYKHIGYESGDARDDSCFETDEAKRVGAVVLADFKRVGGG
jgi:hypothetical protein